VRHLQKTNQELRRRDYYQGQAKAIFALSELWSVGNSSFEKTQTLSEEGRILEKEDSRLTYLCHADPRTVLAFALPYIARLHLTEC